MTRLLQQLRILVSGQIVWLIIVASLSVLFVYGNRTATRMFTRDQSENWDPSGPGGSTYSRSSHIHHK